MTEDPLRRPGPPAKRADGPATRADREAEALRAHRLKRTAPSRARKAQDRPPPAPDTDDTERR